MVVLLMGIIHCTERVQRLIANDLTADAEAATLFLFFLLTVAASVDVAAFV